DVRRRDVVVETAPIVPHHEDRGRAPERRFADRIDHAGYPRRTVPAAAVGMVRRFAGRRNPGNGGERPVSNVFEEPLLRRDDVLPIGTVPNVTYRLIARPHAVRRIRNAACIEAPRSSGSVEFVAERLIIEGGVLRSTERTILDQRLEVVVTVPASPLGQERNVDARVRLSRNNVLMENEALV